MSIIIEIPMRTPTLNHMYGQKANGRRYIKKEGVQIKKNILLLVSTHIKNLNINLEEYKNKKLKLFVEIYENWYTKKKEVKTKDLSNREKFLSDSIFEALGIDDKFIWEHSMKKIQSKDEEKAVITIEAL